MADATTASRIVAGAPRYALIDVRIDRAKLAEITREIQAIPGAMDRAIPPAMNAAASETKTDLYRAFAARMNIARKTSIKDRLTIRPKASRGSWTAGVRIALTRFTVASFKGTRQTKAGVQWSPASGRQQLIPRAFIQHGLTHYRTGEYLDVRQAWRRAISPNGRRLRSDLQQIKEARLAWASAEQLVPRYPIKVMRGPSLAIVFSNDSGFQAEAERKAGQILEKKLDQQVDRILQR